MSFQKKQGIIVAGVFLLSIYGFLLAAIVLPDKTLSEEENRSLATRPQWQKETVLNGKYSRAWEKYVNDQFPLRSFFISSKSKAEHWQGKKDSNGVYFGADDYLLQKLEPPEAGRIEKNLQGLSRFLEKHTNYEAVLCLVPTSTWVLQDKLPKYAQPLNERAIAGQIAEAAASVQRLRYADLFSALKDKEQAPLYYRTDHHYTTLGAYETYAALGDALGYAPLALESFEKQQVATDFYGTLYAKGLFDWLPTDTIDLYVNKDLQATLTVMDDGSTKKGFYDFDKLKTWDKYAVFLGGNYGYLKIETNVKNGRKLYLVKDSYANALVPFLANHYQEIHLFDLRYYRLPFEQFLATDEPQQFLFLYNTASYCKEGSIYQIQYL